ncbi:CobW family GTP-binding protein [Pseudomonas monteilii]|uniref:CobW family GTP-binding protein n=1 Tax=Pseudomonas monteilii TaxID=76759 RepID=UPI003CFC5B47
MNKPSNTSLIPVTLLTGFLGSGKTTLLNQLVGQREFANTLIIINEFGEMALDHLLVTHSQENIVMEMGSGCVCCTIRGDLVQTLRDITWRFTREGQRQFDRVLIETTGLADPAPIIHTLMTHEHVAPKYRLDGVVTTVDLATGMATLDRHPEAIKQAAIADVLLLTKGDLISLEDRTELLERISVINPAAPRWEILNGELQAQKVLNIGLFSHEGKSPDVGRWLNEKSYKTGSPKFQIALQPQDSMNRGLFSAGLRAPQHDVNRHDDRIRAFCFTIDNPISELALECWLEVLMSVLGNRILRVKGIINLEGFDTPAALHGVQHIFHQPAPLPAWPNEDRRSRFVFITQDVTREVIEMTFRAFKDKAAHIEGISV